VTSTAGQSVLVTGGSGFIGRHLVRRLIARGCRVSCLVRATSRVDELRAAGAGLIACDIADRAAIARAIASSNARSVFHLAGLVRAINLGEFMQVNACGVEVVAQACTDQPDRPVLVLVSSLAAAGPSGERPTVEGDPPVPVSDYGRSKFAGDKGHEVRLALPITVCGLHRVGGAGMRVYPAWRPIARTGLVPRIRPRVRSSPCRIPSAPSGWNAAARGVAGHGTASRRCRDICISSAAIARALGKPQPRILRLPGWSLRTIGRFGDVMSRIRRRPGWVGGDKIREHLAGSWTCSSAKARQQLGWSPAVALADRLLETARWYRDARWL
jgi:nucleoside-diphosphate-sugar epimerase